jgi:hypothetical protein
VTWLKPKTSPSWLARETLAALPVASVLREVRYHIGTPGFRTRQMTLVAMRLDAAAYRVADRAELYRRRWRVEVCQTQPVTMTWYPLRRATWTINDLRGPLKREDVGDIHLLGRHHDFPDQAVGNSLALSNRTPVQIGPQPPPKGFGVSNDLLPTPRPLLRPRELLTCLLDLLALGRQFQPPTWSCTQAHNLRLIGIQSALALPLQTLPALQELGVLRRQGGAALWLGRCPGLMPAGNHCRCRQYGTEGLPNDGIEPIGPHAPGGAWMDTPTRQRRLPSTRILQIRVCFADAPWPVAAHPQPACPTWHQPPQPGAAAGGLIALVGQCGVALSWHLGFREPLVRDDRRGVTPDPFGLRSIVAAALERVQVSFSRLPRSGHDELAIIVARLPGRDAVGQQGSDAGRMPDLVAA